MPTTAEQAFMDDPVQFMQSNIVRIVCGKRHSGIYNFKLVRKQNVTAKRNNRRGREINFYWLQQVNNGCIRAYFLAYQENGCVSTALGNQPNTPSLMVTVNVNGCSFGYTSGGPDTPAIVSHHNDKENGNLQTNIESQQVEGLPQGSNYDYFHQSGYRKVRNGVVDHNYNGTIFGVRNGSRWSYYVQSRKDLMPEFRTKYWTLKGVKEINPI